MTRARRRSTHTNTQKIQEHSVSSRGSTPVQNDAESAQGDKDSCPACSADSENVFGKESWVLCDHCKTWYHWRCAGSGGDLETVDKWYCKSCLDTDSTLAITFKGPTRKSVRKRTQRDYANLNSGLESNSNRWLRLLATKDIKDASFQKMQGSNVGMQWMEEDDTAMTEPIVIEKPDGLGMKMPSSDFTVDDVTELVGENTPLEVIDVATQSASPGWTLGKWNDYFNLEPASREKIYNVISLEVSGTKLSDMILPPRLVRELDWVENYWPSTRKGKGNAYPKVQLYCLMGVANAWTDWHIDFAGSSVYYHIVYGSKVFYFIRPTPPNLAAYQRWSGTELQNHCWLGDMVDEVVKVELREGNTMIIPTGWIHAVYTPIDTIVFGGNFLHSYNVATQLKVRNIEIATQVPKKFRFPLFSKLCWYVGDKVLRDVKLSGGTAMPPRVLESMLALVGFLVSEARTLEKGSEAQRKEVREQIPSDRIKDASAMARELRWRVKLAGGYASDEELECKASNPNKRRRVVSSSPIPEYCKGPFRNFRPKAWDSIKEDKLIDETKMERRKRPGESKNWTEDWIEENPIQEESDEAEVKRRHELIFKVRKTAEGVERHRIERIIELWRWP